MTASTPFPLHRERACLCGDTPQLACGMRTLAGRERPRNAYLPPRVAAQTRPLAEVE